MLQLLQTKDGGELKMICPGGWTKILKMANNHIMCLIHESLGNYSMWIQEGMLNCNCRIDIISLLMISAY